MEVILRKWKMTDLENLVKHANNYNIAKNLTDRFPYPYTEKDGREYIEMALIQNPIQMFAIDVDGNAVGSIGIFPQSDIHAKNAEMGYWLSEEYWGKGIMPKAINQIVEYGFNTFDITRIFAGPFGTNQQSQRVLEKAGFTLEAKFEKALYKNGEYIDELIYAIRKDGRH
ncbi:MAG: GNAT family protein [Dysgonomonas sp.]|nr:GNAT family protein [Dysgonomonas sp.]